MEESDIFLGGFFIGAFIIAALWLLLSVSCTRDQYMKNYDVVTSIHTRGDKTCTYVLEKDIGFIDKQNYFIDSCNAYQIGDTITVGKK